MSGKTTNLKRTASERLFEAYLSEHQLADFEFEPEVKTMGRRPDYRVSLEGSDIFFEVKEFAPHPQLPSGGSFDVYRPIRPCQRKLWPCGRDLVFSCRGQNDSLQQERSTS